MEQNLGAGGGTVRVSDGKLYFSRGFFPYGKVNLELPLAQIKDVRLEESLQQYVSKGVHSTVWILGEREALARIPNMLPMHGRFLSTFLISALQRNSQASEGLAAGSARPCARCGASGLLQEMWCNACAETLNSNLIELADCPELAGYASSVSSAYASGNGADLLSCFHEDAVFHDAAGNSMSPDGLAKSLAENAPLLQSLRFSIRAAYKDDSDNWLVWEILSPNGNTAHMTERLNFRDGKLAEGWVFRSAE